MHASTLSLATSIPTTTSSFCAIIQLPSLLGSGSKPVQLFGFKEDTGSVPRSPTGSRPLSTNGLRSSDGRLVRTARSHILADFANTRARRKPLKPLRAGMPGDSGVLVVTRVRSTNTKCTRGCGCNGHPAFPTPSLGGRFINGSGASRGEVANVCLLNASTPHSQPSSPAKAGDPVFRGANDGIDRSQRTGYSAFAEYDDLCEEATKQSRLRHSGMVRRTRPQMCNCTSG